MKVAGVKYEIEGDGRGGVGWTNVVAVQGREEAFLCGACLY